MYKVNGIKTCMELYSQEKGTTLGWYSESKTNPTEEDFKLNGRYCKSGLAYPMNENKAMCTEFKEMKFAGEVIQPKAVTVNQTFPCNPQNQDDKCKLYFDVMGTKEEIDYTNLEGSSRGYVENQCKCALTSDPTEGYCSSVLGHDKYRKAMMAMKTVLSSSNCHTMDRGNLRAQKDGACGIGVKNDEWRFAVDQLFNVTYWPYIQYDNSTFGESDHDPYDKYKCVRKFFSDSYDQLILEGAIYGLAFSTIAISLTIVSSWG